MGKRYSILHISDLHKPENSNLDNLFYSLQKDCDAYTVKGIVKPEIIVVSGDLVEGTQKDGAEAEDIIQTQYAEAKEFLNKLVDFFLDGDKRRLIIVPGNHDYCYKISSESMSPSPNEKVEEDYKSMRMADPNVRWNWYDRKFYHITKPEVYEKRFDLYKLFYNDFYAGIRKTPEQIDRDSYIIELPLYKIAFVCFNSCYRLDHLNPMGCICPDAVTHAHERLSQLKNMGYLLVSVWHHHVSGLPVENNYMDYRILGAMMDEGIKVGLFGHQHVSTAVQEYNDITTKQSILLISSGSLYGNKYQLTTGVPRQYNLIEMNFGDDEVKLKLNVRKDNSQYGYDIPQWILSPIGARSLPCYEHTLQIEKAQIEYLVEELDGMVRESDNYVEACLRLAEYGLENELALKYFDSYISKVNDKEQLKKLLRNPNTISQYMTAFDAAVGLKDKDWIKELMNNERFKNERSAYLSELREKANKLI